jgi:enoyl-CoA hydratase
LSIRLEPIQDTIALLTISRPETRNALGWREMEQFAEAVETAVAWPELRALVLTGSGQAFISGGDLRELAGYPAAEDGRRLSATMTLALARLESLPCPVIAAVNGPARGGGTEIALACDLRVLSKDADLGFVQINLGLTPGWGGGQRLLRLAGYSRALEWLSSGRILSAGEALAAGLANRVVPPGRALDEALAIAQTIAVRPIEAVQAVKRLLRAGLTFAPGEAALREAAEFPMLWEADAHLKAVAAFLNRS